MLFLLLERFALLACLFLVHSVVVRLLWLTLV